MAILRSVLEPLCRDPALPASRARSGREHRFDVVYYVTNGQTWSKSQSDEQNLTPVLLEDDKVIGWGWAFIDRTPRYVSGPFVMPKQ